MSLLLDYNPFSGSIETFDYDESTDTIIIKRRCDVTAIIDRNKELQNHTDGWVGQGRDMRLAASIPLDVAYKWLVEHGVSCWKKTTGRRSGGC
jgi:hypothetical protein